MDSVTKGVVTSWPRPSQVLIDEGLLVVRQWKSAYPLTEATGRALYDLIRCVQGRNEDAIEFTLKWGFFYEGEVFGVEGQGPPVFPLDLFFWWRGWIDSLIRLIVAARDQDLDAAKAVEHFWDCVTERDRILDLRSDTDKRLAPSAKAASETWVELWPEDVLKDRYADPLYNLLTAKERRSFRRSHGPHAPRYLLQDYIERSVGSGSNEELAARIVTVILDALPSSRFRAKRGEYGFWTFEERPTLTSLDQVLLWDLRQNHALVKYRICKNCGRAFTLSRSDQVYCSKSCGSKIRMQRWRDAKARG